MKHNLYFFLEYSNIIMPLVLALTFIIYSYDLYIILKKKNEIEKNHYFKTSTMVEMYCNIYNHFT
jgi:hypothetical protein